MQNVLEEGKSAAKDLLHEGKVVAKERYEATTRRVEDATRENPLKALAIVAAVGFVFGILFGRR